MSRVWSNLAVASVLGVLVGCGAGVEDVGSYDDETGDQGASLDLRRDLKLVLKIDPKEEQDPCELFNPYFAALGEATVACLGTIKLDAYVVVRESTDLKTRVQRTVLKKKFDKCVDGSVDPKTKRDPLQDIDDLLALQHPEVEKEMPGAAACFTKQWQGWQEDMRAKGINTCPTFRRVQGFNIAGEKTVVNPDFPDAPQYFSVQEYADKYLPDLPPYKENPKGQEVKEIPWLAKSHAYYKVAFPDGRNPNEGCKDALSCANECGSAFPSFVVEDQHPEYFVGDPSWWVESEYAPGSNPYMVAGYYHPMSFQSPLPGAIYGHRARAGEACSRWAGGFAHYVVGLVEWCANPSLRIGCLSRCSGPTPAVYSAGYASADTSTN